MIDFWYGVLLDTIDEHMLGFLRNERNDERIWKWCRQYDLISESDQKKWYERINADPSIRMYVMRARNEEIVGVCGLTSINHVNQTAEFSIYVFPQWQRRNFGLRGLQTLIRHGFENLNLHRIWGESFAGNPGITNYRKLGFQKEGTLRDSYFRGGKFIDSEIWSLLATDLYQFAWDNLPEVNEVFE